MLKWHFQEWGMCWSLWAIGFEVTDRRGWEMDTLTIFIGPFRLEFLSSTQMDSV